MKLEELKTLLDFPKRIVIVTHYKPDGDAIGSSLGLYNYLIQKNHQAVVVSPNDFPEFLCWMPGQETVIDFEKTTEKAKELVSNAEIIFCLDFNMLYRTEGLAEPVKQSKAVKVLIDHHLNPDQFCDYILSDTNASSTCELVYRFIDSLNDKKLINKQAAACLYAGIMTDTASFRFESMRPETHRIVANLLETGVENYKVHEAVYDNFSAERIKFLGYCINDKMQVLPEYNTAIIVVTREEMNRFNHQTGDTEGVVNYGLMIKGIRLAVLFIEKRHEVKISFRSKGDFSVQELSSKHFNGGGHKNASGANLKISLEETIAKFMALLPNYKDELTK